jgi:DNA-binding transcriptional ArsR family regulator
MTLRDALQQADMSDNSLPFVSNAPPAPRRPNRRARRAARVNYRGRNRAGTERKQEAILRLLAMAPVGFSVADIGRALGISRQLALYHVKKLAAGGQLTMILEPCERNGGLQYAVWDTGALMRAFARRVVDQAEAA